MGNGYKNANCSYKQEKYLQKTLKKNKKSKVQLQTGKIPTKKLSRRQKMAIKMHSAVTNMKNTYKKLSRRQKMAIKMQSAVTNRKNTYKKLSRRQKMVKKKKKK